MWNIGDKIWIYLWTLPGHPDTQYPGVGAGDFSYRDGDRYAVAIREVEVVSISNRWNCLPGQHSELIRVRDPWAQVKDAKTGLFGPPMSTRGVQEETQRVYPFKFTYSTREAATISAYSDMPQP